MKNMHDTAIAIMAKEPRVGSTKTRLCPPFTPEEAAGLYEALLLDTILLCSRLHKIDLTIAVTPPESIPYFEGISPAGTSLLPVTCRDIGECLTITLKQLLDLGYRKAFALNSDGPSLPVEYIYQAKNLLDDHNLVLGPGEDGGYYLVGLKQSQPALFTGIEWSTSRVLSQTLDKTKSLDLSVAQTPPWYDVDTVDEVQRLKTELERRPKETLIHSRRFFDSQGA